MSDLKVTAVIPCYNGEQFIGEAIQHVLDQTRPADELIVIDDGSTDSSPDIIAGFDGIRVIRHPTNYGLPTGRNNALKAARGDILVYIDVDAYAEPDFIEKLLPCYKDETIAGASGAGHEVRGDHTANRWRQQFLPQNHGPDYREDVPFLFGICSSFRKKALLDVGGFDPVFTTNGEDVDVCIRLRQRGYKLVYTPDAQVFHHRDDSVKTLMAMIHRWWLWGHLAQTKNDLPYFMEHLRVTKYMTHYIMRRAMEERDTRLMIINFMFLGVALYSIFEAEIKGPPKG